ncbi:MAG: ectonucleotide pyrophosphatase/phosphodiesterase [Anaerolineae bacterium]|nr:ectonucleotide pyrophosphatase/phosphodiesterase [Anaerolineae bacterium]
MTQNVVFILIDGLRPDAIAKADCPNLRALMARSAYTLCARSVMPSITLPCHMSIFHSVPPERHGIVSNTWVPMARPLPGLIEVANANGVRCAHFYNWEPLRNVNTPENLWMSFCNDTSKMIDGDAITVEVAASMIPRFKPQFSFVYLGTVDTMGHVFGWMNDGYMQQIARVDVELGKLLAALPADTHIVLQSDHGGHDRTHGTEMPEDMLIPWMAAGPGIKSGVALQSPISLLDTAPTIARLLGFKPHPQWEGRVVDEIFSAS